MRKDARSRTKILGLGLGLSMLIAGVLLLLPPVQLSLLSLLDKRLDALSVQAAALHVAPWGISAERLSLSLPGLAVDADVLDADIAVLQSLLRRRLVLVMVRGEAIRIDLEPTLLQPGVPDEPESREAFSRFAQYLRWPRRLELRQVSVAGELALTLAAARSEGLEQMSGSWSLSAVNLAPDRQATISARTALTAIRGGEPGGGLTGELEGSADIAATGVLRELSAHLQLSPVNAGSAKNPRGLNVELALALDDARESGRLSAFNRQGVQVALVEAAYSPGSEQGEANWALDLRPGLVAAFLGPGAYAELAGESIGRADLDIGVREIALEALLDAKGEGWSWFDERFRYLGAQTVHAEISALGWGDRWRVDHLRGRLWDEQEREVLRLGLLQSFGVDLAARQVTADQWGEPALRLSADHMPLAWLRGFDPRQIFHNGLLHGKLHLVPHDRRHIEIVADQPMRLENLRLRRGEQTLPVISVRMQPRAQVEDGEFSAHVDDLVLEADTGLKLRFRGVADTALSRWPVVGFRGAVALRAPALQRRISGLDAVRGLAQVELDLGQLRLDLVGLALDVKALDGERLASILIEGDAPLGVSLTSRAIYWDEFEPQRAQLRFFGTPISWISPFLPEIDLVGGAVYGELHARARKGAGFELSADQPFEVRNIVPLYRGRRIARSLSLSVSPRLALSNRGGRVDLRGIRLRAQRLDRVDAELALSWATNPPQRMSMELDVVGYFPSLADSIGALGDLHWAQRGVVDLSSGVIDVEQLTVDVDDSSGSRVFEMHALKPFQVANDPLGFAVRGGGPRVLKATLTPLKLQSLLPGVLGFDVEGELERGVFYGRVDRRGRLVIAAPDPLVFNDVSLAREDSPLFEQLQIGLTYEVAYSVAGLEARSFDINAGGPGAEKLAKVSMRAVAPLTTRQTLRSFDVDLQLQLAQMSQQPIMRDIKPLDAGRLLASWSLSNGPQRMVKGQVEVLGASETGAGRLPDLKANLALDTAPGQEVALSIPVTLESARGRSDLAFTGTLRAVGKRHRFEALLEGRQLIAPDVRQFYSLVTDPAAPADDRGEQGQSRPDPSLVRRWRERRDERPFWGERYLGHAQLKLDRLQLAHHAVEEIRGQAQMLREQLSLYGIHARLLGGQLRSDGSLRYSDQQAEPYRYHYRLRAQDMRLDELLQPLDPAQPPVAEGLFTLSSELQANGLNLLDLALNSAGEISLDGRAGVFRGLAGRGASASKAAKVAGTLTFSRQLRAIGRLLDDLSELSFSGFGLKLRRHSPRVVSLEDTRLISPQLRLQGSGDVGFKSGMTLAESDLQATLGLATRGDMSILFDGMGLLDEAADNRGYRAMYRDLEVGGTLAEPDFGDFWNLLDEAAANASGAFGLGLRAINRKLDKSSTR